MAVIPFIDKGIIWLVLQVLGNTTTVVTSVKNENDYKIDGDALHCYSPHNVCFRI